MARDHARIRLDIWSDDDWRDLSSSGQWLYLHLLTSPRLSFCGVVDWRPPKIAAHTAELTAADVEAFAVELEAGRYIVVDRESEECLIRSFVKHDGLMKSPNMAKALVKDHAAIGSAPIRAVIVHELTRLRGKHPDLKGWPAVEALLGKRSMSPQEAFDILAPNPSGNPSGNPLANPSDEGSANPSPNPSATPFLPSSLPPDLPQGSSRVGKSPGSSRLTLARAKGE